MMNDDFRNAETSRPHPQQRFVKLATILILIAVVLQTFYIPSLQASAASVVLVGAGDISSCAHTADTSTAKILDSISGTFFTTGDNVYTSGTYTQYMNCYHPTWGRHKSRTKPVPGNHEYNTSGASGYFKYFSNVRSYYAFNLGDWRIYALNSNIDVSATSAQVQWLKNDLGDNPRKCVLAYWHHPHSSAPGVLKMTLSSTSYSWKLVPVAGKSFTDSGATSCHEPSST
jgi:hypothetical protein